MVDRLARDQLEAAAVGGRALDRHVRRQASGRVEELIGALGVGKLFGTEGEVYLGVDGNYRSRFSSNPSPSRVPA